MFMVQYRQIKKTKETKTMIAYLKPELLEELK
nr:MAG TPA: hypothetical protein [Caudoviricetes sp.]